MLSFRFCRALSAFFSLALLCLSTRPQFCCSFLHVATTSQRTTTTRLNAQKKFTLTDETTWKLRFLLKGVKTEQGKKVDEIYTMTAKFIEEEGYEPPQGYLEQVASPEDRLNLVGGPKCRWKLSEDPNDRKDGLWVWGLFAEPLYPFLLLSLQTEVIPLAVPTPVVAAAASGENDEEDATTSTAVTTKPEVDSIPPLQLYCQMTHQRDDELGVVLGSNGAAMNLNVRQVESIKADPFGAAKVEIYDEVCVGTLSVQPVEES